VAFDSVKGREAFRVDRIDFEQLSSLFGMVVCLRCCCVASVKSHLVV
jgi:hypothetical protein